MEKDILFNKTSILAINLSDEFFEFRFNFVGMISFA